MLLSLFPVFAQLSNRVTSHFVCLIANLAMISSAKHLEHRITSVERDWLGLAEIVAHHGYSPEDAVHIDVVLIEFRATYGTRSISDSSAARSVHQP